MLKKSVEPPEQKRRSHPYSRTSTLAPASSPLSVSKNKIGPVSGAMVGPVRAVLFNGVDSQTPQENLEEETTRSEE